MFCQNCGESLHSGATACPRCQTPTSAYKAGGATPTFTSGSSRDADTVRTPLDVSGQAPAAVSYSPPHEEEPSDAMIGHALAGRYRIIEKIGEGGMGRVYKAEHLRMKRITAIKILSTDLAHNPEFVARFQREAQMASNISHPNAVSIYDFGEADNGIVYLAMEFLDGESLSQLMKRGGPMPLDRVVRIARQAAEALEAGHKLGIVHRDFKPDNLLICRGADGADVVKVVDFGVAKQTQAGADSNTLTQQGMVLGTPQYMSPEQLLGEPLDARSDLYSLGVVVYQMLVRAMPFEGGTPQNQMMRRLVEDPKPLRLLNPNLSPQIEAVVMRTLARNVNDRYATTVQFVTDLERAANLGTAAPTAPFSGATSAYQAAPTAAPFYPSNPPSAQSSAASMMPPTVQTPAGAWPGAPAQQAAPRSNAKLLIVLVSILAVAGIAAGVYFTLGSSPASKNASALRNAVSKNQLVTLSGNDAYTYYMQLRSVDPTHEALREVGQQVLPQLQSAGEELLRKKMSVGAEKDTLQDWQKAQNLYEWAHDIEPNNKQIEARWRFAQGEVAKQQDKKDDAEKSYQAAAQIGGAWALPQNSLGLLRMENKRWGEAIPYFSKAISQQPDWEIPYNNLGTAYLYLNDYEKAENWYHQAIEKNPNWARPHYWLGVVYEQANMKEEAIEEYETALSLSPDSLPIDATKVRDKITKLQQQ